MLPSKNYVLPGSIPARAYSLKLARMTKDFGDTDREIERVSGRQERGRPGSGALHRGHRVEQQREKPVPVEGRLVPAGVQEGRQLASDLAVRDQAEPAQTKQDPEH